MNVTIHPKKLSGEIVIPPSKSLSHRAIIAAGLASGRSVISNVLFSKDILATIDAMRSCGATIEQYEDSLVIYGGKVRRLDACMNANESGSTIRFMIPIALTCQDKIVFTGENNLVHRPLEPYFEIFESQKMIYNHPEDSYLPLEVTGILKPTTYEIRGDISSQFITGLLYALPLLNGESRIVITTNLESKGYVDLTLDILAKYGIRIINNDYKEFIIEGNQEYRPYDYEIEGDYSQSAFFLVANCMGADISLKAMNPYSFQGDKKILSDLTAMGAKIEACNDTLRCLPCDTIGTTIDFSQSPDLGPALTVLASVSKGKTIFLNAGRLRIKECDRISCMVKELSKMGANLKEYPDGMEISGIEQLNGATIDSHNDHRVAMAIAMASLKTSGDIKILNAECVCKSFPHFWEVFESLGGSVEYEK